MSTLIEFVFFGIVALVAGGVIRAINHKRAVRRSAEMVEFGSAEFPCRLSWEAATGTKGFVFGKISSGSDGKLIFSRRWRGPTNLPRSEWVHREDSWRPGLVTLRYTAPN